MVKMARLRAGQRDILYRNNGDNTFSDVSASAGIRGYGLGQSATWWDFNQDNYPDLYVSNDWFGQDILYKNNQDGTFSDVTRKSLPHTPWFSMGSDAADINNDGLFDFIASDMSGTNHYRQKMGMGDMADSAWFLETAEPRQYMRNALYINTGTDYFMEAAQICSLVNTDWTWTVKFADLDNDGFNDLFVTNGMTRDYFNSDLAHQAKALSSSPEKLMLFWKDKPIKKDAPSGCWDNACGIYTIEQGCSII